MIKMCYNQFVVAPMAELVDAADSKSAPSDRVPVQVRMGAPFCILKSTLVGFFVFLRILSNFIFNGIIFSR